MESLGGLDGKRSRADQCGHVLKHPLDIIRIRQIGGLCTPGGHEQEDAPHGGFQLEHEALEGLVLVQVATGERRVDLHAQAGRMGALHGREGAVESAGQAAKGIVRLLRRTVQAQGDALYARGLDLRKIDVHEAGRG